MPSSFNWQRFFSGDLIKNHAERYVHAVSRFKKYDEERIKDCRDPFATNVLQASLWESRTRVTLEYFRWSRFFCVFIRDPKTGENSFRMCPCCMINDWGIRCSKECDPFGHHAHLCDATNKTIDHNHARDIVKSIGAAIAFVANKEVVMCPWEKSPTWNSLIPPENF